MKDKRDSRATLLSAQDEMLGYFGIEAKEMELFKNPNLPQYMAVSIV